jgi:hypothetical protein
MKLAEGELPLATYPAAAPKRGVQATLTMYRLVWQDGVRDEHFPLDKITCVTLGFARSARRIGWSIALLLLALGLGIALGWTQAHLPTLVESMMQTLADHENPQRLAAARRVYEQRLDLLMLAMLPAWALTGAAAMLALWLGYTGLRGETRVEITLFAVVRRLSQPGRDPRLLEFGEQVARQLQ